MQPAAVKSHHTESSSRWNVAAQSPLDDRISAFAAGGVDRKPEISKEECKKKNWNQLHVLLCSFDVHQSIFPIKTA